MIELLVAVLFLSACSVAIIEGVEYANVQSAYAQRRSIILGALQSEIESARGLSAKGTLKAATKSSTLTVTGLQSSVTISSTISAMNTASTVYTVTAKATWNEPAFGGVRADSATLTTWVRT